MSGRPALARVLTAQNAVINTVSVQIKTLTVSGKQVTLAVFRQLIEEHIFDFTIGGLRGVGWGHVRYLIDALPDQAINLVWQRGDELRRCIVDRELPYAPGWHWDQQRVDAFLANPIRNTDSYREHHSFCARDIRTAWGEDLSDSLAGRFTVPHPYPRTAKEEQENRAATDDYRAQVRAIAEPILRRIVKIEEAYNRHLVPLFDLPQLFIAV